MAALGSYLDARTGGGIWHVRMEDIDPPREVPGAADGILRALETLGLEWDGAVLYQSQRTNAYRETVDKLLGCGHAYWCTCSRRDILDHPINRAHVPGTDLVYPGTCRNRHAETPPEGAVRLRVDGGIVEYDDDFQGHQARDLVATSGDFVIQRRDGLFSYQLAVTVDDNFQRISRVVRGCDLMESTPRQIHLRQRLNMSIPRFAHMPVVIDANGDKLSKQTGAGPLDTERAGRVLIDALAFLRQSPPAEIMDAGVGEILTWARANWRPAAFHGVREAAPQQSPPI